jgi:hypothetical protein
VRVCPCHAIESGRLDGPRDCRQVHLIRCALASHFSHDLHRGSLLVGQAGRHLVTFDHSQPIMSSAYSPTSPTASHTTRKASHGYSVSDANIRNFAPVARIMKTALPENAKIAKEAKECMQECVSEFISFITSEGMSPMLPLPAAFWSAARLTLLLLHSLREMSARKAQDCEWRGYLVCHDFAGLRELLRSTEDLPFQVSRSEFCLSLYIFVILTKDNV